VPAVAEELVPSEEQKVRQRDGVVHEKFSSRTEKREDTQPRFRNLPKPLLGKPENIIPPKGGAEAEKSAKRGYEIPFREPTSGMKISVPCIMHQVSREERSGWKAKGKGKAAKRKGPSERWPPPAEGIEKNGVRQDSTATPRETTPGFVDRK